MRISRSDLDHVLIDKTYLEFRGARVVRMQINFPFPKCSLCPIFDTIWCAQFDELQCDRCPIKVIPKLHYYQWQCKKFTSFNYWLVSECVKQQSSPANDEQEYVRKLDAKICNISILEALSHQHCNIHMLQSSISVILSKDFWMSSCSRACWPFDLTEWLVISFSFIWIFLQLGWWD